MDDVQNADAGGLEELLAGIEQSDATEEAKAEPTANAETTDTENEGSEDKPEGEDKEHEDEDEGEQPKPKKPSGSERLKRRISALEAQLAQQDRRPPAAGDEKALASAVEAEIGAPPKESEFPDWFAYERALTAYETEKRIVSRELKGRAAQAEQATRARVAELVEDHNDRLEELERRLPGSRAKLAAVDGVPVARHVEHLILESEKSAHLALHFAEHPEKLAALNRLPPVAAARELGRLESRLSLPKPRTETKAPAPIRSPKGGAAPSSPDADLQAWLTKQYGKR
jgi:hypothetical protein